MKRGEIYPSWRYHQTSAPVLCLNADQDAALGEDWSDADIRVFEAPAPEPVEDAAAVEAAPVPKKRGRKPKA